MPQPKIHPLRRYRKRHHMSLDDLAQEIQRVSGYKPSKSKLSRIETGQPIPISLVRGIQKVTGLRLCQLMPDLARSIRMENRN